MLRYHHRSMEPSPHTARHLSITGRVQGVGYRAWFSHNATKAGLDGWVRNRTDGSVEAVIAGPAHSIKTFIATCWQGPVASHVTHIDVTDTAMPENKGFVRRDTC